MASIYSLPVELKETIFAETSFLDLNNLSKTCKSIRAVALPALFRQIALIWDANLSNCPPIVALFRCILENPNLGKMVKELHLQTQGYRGFSSLGSNSDMLLPIHTHCFTAQDWGIFQKALQSCSGEENNENVDPTTQERDLNAAISILISHCTRIELLRMDIELLVNNHRFPTMLQSTLCQTLSHLGKQPWVEKLAHVAVTCGAKGQERKYATNFQVPPDIFLQLLYLPAVKKLDLTLFPDLHTSRGIQKDIIKDTIWPFPQAPMAFALTTLQLRRSPALPNTLDILLSATPSLTALEYDCLLPSSQTPFCLSTLRQALNRVRGTLKNLSIRYEVFADDATEVESIGTILVNNLGSLCDFPALITLETSLAILYGQVREVNVPFLLDLLPPNLQHLTINDDLWGFYAFVWEGLEVMEVLRKFLTGQRKKEAYWDEARERWEVTWAHDGQAGWREKTPHLKEFVLDMRRRGWSFYDFWDNPTQRISLQQACDEQGIRCLILYDT